MSELIPDSDKLNGQNCCAHLELNPGHVGYKLDSPGPWPLRHNPCGVVVYLTKHWHMPI